MGKRSFPIPKKELFFISLILILFIGMILSDTEVKILVNYDEEMLQITSPRLNVDIAHSHVLNVELIDMPTDFGTKIGDSYEHEVYCAGTWENADWGSYTLCVLPGNSKAVLVRMDSTTVIFCCTTDEKTQTLFDSYSGYLSSLAA